MYENFPSPSSDKNNRERSTEHLANVGLEEGITPSPVREIMDKNATLFQSGALKEGVVRNILIKESKMLETAGLSQEESVHELERVFNNLRPRS